MARGTIALEGGKKLERKLKLLPPRVEKKISRQALRAGAKIIHRQARANAPEGKGPLKKSIKVRAGKRRRGKVGILVQTADGDYKGETFYGSFREYGHKIGRRSLGSSRADADAQPFMGPAFETKKDEAAREIGSRLREGIKREALAL